MPLGRKNYWVYLDSLYDDNGQFTMTRIDTLRFTQTHRSPDSLIWWSPNKWKGFLHYNYSTDSVLYTLGSRWGFGLQLPWAYPISQDSLETDCPYSDHSTFCKAWKIPGTVSVPAGNFTQCIRFLKKWFIGQDIDFDFKPGVGVLKFRFYVITGNQRTYLQTSTLLSYHIE